MIPTYEDGGLRLWHGPNMEILPTFADASFDSIVTDPPYELGFMGKGWDSSGIAYDVDVWRECLRVLKPGGHLLAFGGSRTWHRMAVAIEDAGFEMRDSIAWLYGQGFPKSVPVAAEGWEGWGTALKPAFEPIVVARKPFRGTVAGNVLASGTGALNIDATRIPTGDKLRGGSQTRGHTMNGGWDRPWMHDAEATAASAERSRAQVEKAEALGRHPANVILDHSQAEALDAQTGILTSGVMKARTNREPRKGGVIYGADKRNIVAGDTYGDSGGASRFFTTIQEEPCAPSTATATSPTATSATSATPAPSGTGRSAPAADDSGGTSFPTFRYEAKAPTSERPNVEGTVHATVKPLALIRWLVRLVTRPGGRVLDLYAGSGTTGEAALLEGMEVDLIELEEDHLPLILARVRKPLHPAMFGDWEDAS